MGNKNRAVSVSNRIYCGKEGCHLRGCISSVVERMTHMAPESVVENMLKGVVESTLKVNSELTSECSRRWLDEEKYRLNQENFRLQIMARCFCVTVLALALVLISYNLKGCLNVRGCSPSQAETENPASLSATNSMQVTSTCSVRCDKQ